MPLVQIKPAATAVVIVDDNNDFLSVGGKLHGAVKGFLDAHGVRENINSLMHAARANGISIVRVPMSFAPGYQEMGPEPYGIFKAVKSSGGFLRGTWGAQPADVLDGDPADIVVEGKSTTCAFASTDLRRVLDERGVRTVVLSGLLSNLCIESTMRTAYDAGYEVVVLTDCVAALDEDQHAAAVQRNWPLLSKPMSSAQFLGTLDAAKAVR